MAKADPFEAVRNFEKELCAYTGAPFAVAVNSCCAALLLSCALVRSSLNYKPVFEIPKLTYVGVPMAIWAAGCGAGLRDEDWQGQYELVELPATGPRIWDAARRFTKGMFGATAATPHFPGSGDFEITPTLQCVSFHISKLCGHSQGGAILHNVPEADEWLRRARFDGRREGVHPRDDTFDMQGYHVYMSVDVAAALRWKLSTLPDHNADLPRSDYSDLSLAPIFGGPGR